MSKVYEGIAICGSHPATISFAPFDDDRWIIYACSPHNFEHRKLPRFDEWFEVHKPALCNRTRKQSYQDYVKTLPFVWMRDQKAMQDYPGAKLYPDHNMRKKHGPFHFTSSIALMQMRAISECERLHGLGLMPEPKIEYYGIMQSGATEYMYQRPSIQQLAKESGPLIKHGAPKESKLWEPMPENW